jgi:hypothetical protein
MIHRRRRRPTQRRVRGMSTWKFKCDQTRIVSSKVKRPSSDGVCLNGLSGERRSGMPGRSTEYVKASIEFYYIFELHPVALNVMKCIRESFL